MIQPEPAPDALPYPFGKPHLLELDPRYAVLRDDKGLCPVELRDLGRAWLCSRYADVRGVLTDGRFALTPVAPQPGASRARGAGAAATLTSDQITTVAKAGLKPRQIERLRPATETIADELLDRLGGAGGPCGQTSPADLMAGFVKPLAAGTMCALLDVPPGNRTTLRALLLGAATTATPPSDAEKQDRRELARYLGSLVATRARSDADDLLSGMIRARGEGDDRLTDRQLVAATLRLLLPGLQNMVLTSANFVCALTHHPADLERLRRRQDLVPSAVEELMRFTPFHSTSTFPRYATRDTEIGGTLIRRGEVVVGALCAANRDERAFPLADVFDIQRAENAHLGFGMGRHHCPGAALARMQLQVAIGALARRIDDLRLARPGTGPEPGRSASTVGWFDTLPVTWSSIRT
ncbi:cytochrome P450 [Streptomyces beihaiensis]|uniref:Cytochrome P450 n=1 Tax=Streptomyces beihaiensis TaxID=2984495 RepID=A0ABT3TTF9_9ACTN|nr:cytochrome P450 [Streptomyces beihaiensis]MCX3060302.1 cytochrome P450 [Streptomyces beihaiensis]